MIELYNINDVYFLTSANELIQYAGRDYVSKFIQRESIENRELVTDCTFTMELRDEVITYLRFVTSARLKIIRFIDPVYIQLFTGTLTGISLEGKFAKCKFDSFLARLNTTPKTRYLTKMCPYNLFDNRCKLDKLTVGFTSTVTSVGNKNLGVLGLTDIYKLGFCSFNDIDYYIHNVVGQVAYFYIRPPVEVDSEITVFPGCDKSSLTCRDKFSNAANFGGFVEVPEIEPAGTSLAGGSL